MSDPDYDAGRQSGENDGTWRDNPHRLGSREYFAFADGLSDGRRETGRTPETNEGSPTWA